MFQKSNMVIIDNGHPIQESFLEKGLSKLVVTDC